MNDNEMICYCSGIDKEKISTAIKSGAATIDDLRKMTGACTIGKCATLNPKGRCCSIEIRAILDKFSE
ncbi:MAG: (2Fe-2S)-binding protein [Defluviitaleaceae bacterium]|nr:(2Fe-2S)-binding protein [Defluviitaleaceae bacterium]